MTKNIKKLEKDNVILRKKSEQTDVTLIDMAEEVFFSTYFFESISYDIIYPIEK